MPKVSEKAAPKEAATKNPVAKETQLGEVSSPAASQPVPPVQSATQPPTEPTTFKAIGYVEKSDGQLEAVIMQENEIQVVHLGDKIADRYRVTKITPDTVAAIDETTLQIPILKADELKEQSVETPKLAEAETPLKPAGSPVVTVRRQEEAVGGATPPRDNPDIAPLIATATPSEQPSQDDSNSLGYVEKSDGKVESIVADGDSVRLVPSTEIQLMANADSTVNAPNATEVAEVPTPNRTSPATSGPLPVRAADNSSAQLSAPAFRHRTEHSQSAALSPASGKDRAEATPLERGGTSSRTVARNRLDSSSKSSATFIFQTLGYVQLKNGEVQAIVADGADTYLVKPGQVFAKQYQAVSVDSLLVLAVRKPPSRPLPDFLSAQTDFNRNSASNGKATSSLGNPSRGVAIQLTGQDRQAGLSSSLGINLFNKISLDLNVHSYSYTTDNPKLGY